ncbi:MAG: RagB/SusD family nutrient uptake outer membrane protein [Clostridiales bacterium]|nr:RagB/SusD family nutrient uptake outer membrane protein [Clostridiales bacterium]
MKNIISPILISALSLTLTTGCIEDFQPEGGSVSAGQVANAPGYYNSAVEALTATLSGTFMTGNTLTSYDFGYSSLGLQRDMLGNDIFMPNNGSPFFVWYYNFVGLGPQYAYSSYPWNTYFKWIYNCNNLLLITGDTPSAAQRAGYGQARAMRAMFYMDLAQMYAQQPYTVDKEALTVPIVAENTTDSNNPRVTQEVMWAFILDDLNAAEELLDNYVRTDVYTVDKSVVYGLKARAYLYMGEWADAEKYAKMAQEGYTMMTNEQYLDRNTGFNTPNQSWILATKFEPNSDNIKLNDGSNSWASMMCLEDLSGMGYTSFGYCTLIDRHLYNTIPSTDIRRKAFIDFSIDDLASKEDKVEALKAYADADYTESIYNAGRISYNGGVGGMSVKFRLTGGSMGHTVASVGFSVAYPMMRVEEMKLIEAEAAGMQSEARGEQLLKAFATYRDPGYVYGTHNEAYYNTSTSKFLNEIWWQRRVELWGEGFATFDIKRLQKGVIRSYAGTNHRQGARYNSDKVPDWMTFVIARDEADYNEAIVNNPTPVKPSGDSPEFVW